MKWTLEVIVVPVSDVDRAREFYAGKLGFTVDHDLTAGAAYRIVQLTPPGSGCSIVLGTMPEHDPRSRPGAAPGSLTGLQLVVPDLRAARAELAGRGVPVGEIQVFDGTGFRPARDDDALDNAGFVFFDDPDGNGWAVQQISARG